MLTGTVVSLASIWVLVAVTVTCSLIGCGSSVRAMFEAEDATSIVMPAKPLALAMIW